MDVYARCPEWSNERYLLRQVREEDCAGLLEVYSDRMAVPFFNSDNCHGDDFHYTTIERMAEAIRFWQFSYENRYFVRWSIFDRSTGKAIGTIELFNRDPEDPVDGVGLLRLDLRSDYERAEEIESILGLIIPPAYELFGCTQIWTKAIPQAASRRIALAAIGFLPSEKELTGDDGTKYGDYWFKKQ